MKLTGWFSENTKPVHIGVYKTRHHHFGNEWRDAYSYWNGKEWSNSQPTVNDAHFVRTWTEGAIQEKKWRGLAEQPK